jgi:hypothetical protein
MAHLILEEQSKQTKATAFKEAAMWQPVKW